MFCKCGVEIHPLRVELLKKWNKPLNCINCSVEQKVGGFMTSTGKTERELIISDMDIIDELHQKAARAGTGVSKGVKMRSF